MKNGPHILGKQIAAQCVNIKHSGVGAPDVTNTVAG